MKFNVFDLNANKEKYIIVEYFLKSNTTLKDAAWALAIGQSVGNPNMRSKWETEQLFIDHSCVIFDDEEELNSRKAGIVNIGFPVNNINYVEDGVSHLLCQIMGGQLDIAIIEKCQVLDIKFPSSIIENFKAPKYGIYGIRNFVDSYNKPLLGGIIKPKVAPNVDILLDMVKELVDGGVDFIKEDEIMSNPLSCPLYARTEVIMNYIAKQSRNIIYSVCINSDPLYSIKRVTDLYNLGANSVHINFWSGMGVYKSIRELDLPIFLFFQKSGDKILTNKSHDFHIDWSVICKLAGTMGVDFIHAGMWGGYTGDTEEALIKNISLLRNFNVMPSLSCGMNADLIAPINRRFGTDYMANVGGAIHSHPDGSKAGVKLLRKVIDEQK